MSQYATCDDVEPRLAAAHATPTQAGESAYPYAVVIVLLLTNAFNFIDRQLPYILAEAIRREFGLNDMQLGILNGAAFAVVYAVMAIPLARAADRWGARWVLSGCLFVWSAMTCLGGVARSFWQLAATRFGVALGEAGSSPLSHAVIANYFPPHKRSTPLGLSSLGMSVGSMLGLVLGGWLGQVVGWRTAFLLCGVPGVLLAIAAAWVVREPDRAHTQTAPLSLLATGRHLFAHAWYRHIFFAITVLSMGIYATLTFTPPFLMRVFGMNYQAAGLSLGLVYGVAGIAGALIGGWLGDRLVSRDRRWRLWLPALGFAVAAPCMVAVCFAPTSFISVLFMMVPKFANLLYVAPTFALVQSQVPAEMRATSSAVIYFGMGFIGLSLGPLFVGMLSDYLQPFTGAQSLRYALLFVAVTQVWGATHYLLAARALPKE